MNFNGLCENCEHPYYGNFCEFNSTIEGVRNRLGSSAHQTSANELCSGHGTISTDGTSCECDPGFAGLLTHVDPILPGCRYSGASMTCGGHMGILIS